MDIYSIPVSEKKEGETPIYRNPKSKNQLISSPNSEIYNNL